MLSNVGTAVAVEAPTLGEVDRLKITLLVREFELAQARAEAAQTALGVARERVVERLRLLDADHPGFHFDLGTMTFVPVEEGKK